MIWFFCQICPQHSTQPAQTGHRKQRPALLQRNGGSNQTSSSRYFPLNSVEKHYPQGALVSAKEPEEKQQVPPLRFAPVGMTILLQQMAPRAVRRTAVNGPTELSSRPERSAVEGPAVSLPVLTQTCKLLARTGMI